MMLAPPSLSPLPPRSPPPPLPTQQPPSIPTQQPPSMPILQPPTPTQQPPSTPTQQPQMPTKQPPMPTLQPPTHQKQPVPVQKSPMPIQKQHIPSQHPPNINPPQIVTNTQTKLKHTPEQPLQNEYQREPAQAITAASRQFQPQQQHDPTKRTIANAAVVRDHPTVILLWELLTKGSQRVNGAALLSKLCQEETITTLVQYSKELSGLSNISVVESILERRFDCSSESLPSTLLCFDDFVAVCCETGTFANAQPQHQQSPIHQHGRQRSPTNDTSNWSPAPASSLPSSPYLVSDAKLLGHTKVRSSVERGPLDVEDEDIYRELLAASDGLGSRMGQQSHNIYKQQQHPWGSQGEQHHQTGAHTRVNIPPAVGHGLTAYNHPYTDYNTIDMVQGNNNRGTSPWSQLHKNSNAQNNAHTMQSGLDGGLKVVDTNATNHQHPWNKASTELNLNHMLRTHSPWHQQTPQDLHVNTHVEFDSQSQQQQQQQQQHRHNIGSPHQMQQHDEHVQMSTNPSDPNYLVSVIQEQKHEIELLKRDLEASRKQTQHDVENERAMATAALSKLKQEYQTRVKEANDNLGYFRETCFVLQKLVRQKQREEGATVSGRRSAVDLIDDMLLRLTHAPTPLASHNDGSRLEQTPPLSVYVVNNGTSVAHNERQHAASRRQEHNGGSRTYDIITDPPQQRLSSPTRVFVVSGSPTRTGHQTSNTMSNAGGSGRTTSLPNLDQQHQGSPVSAGTTLVGDNDGNRRNASAATSGRGGGYVSSFKRAQRYKDSQKRRVHNCP